MQPVAIDARMPAAGLAPASIAVDQLQQRLWDAYAELQHAEADRRQLRQMKKTVAQLQAQLAARFRELAVLERMLEEASACMSPAVVGGVATPADAAPGVIGQLKAWAVHRRQWMRVQGSGLFDAQWYLRTYPDVAASGLDPLRHYLRYGIREGRGVGPAFDVESYVSKHPEAAGSALLHYLENKEAECGR